MNIEKNQLKQLLEETFPKEEKESQIEQKIGKQFLELIFKKLCIKEKTNDYQLLKDNIAGIIGKACPSQSQKEWVQYCFGCYFMNSKLKGYAQIQDQIHTVYKSFTKRSASNINRSMNKARGSQNETSRILNNSIFSQNSQINSTIGMNSSSRNQPTIRSFSKQVSQTQEQSYCLKSFHQKKIAKRVYQEEQSPQKFYIQQLESMTNLMDFKDKPSVDEYLNHKINNWNSQLNFLRQKLNLQWDWNYSNDGRQFNAQVTINIKEQTFVQCYDIVLKGSGRAGNKNQARNLASKDILSKIYTTLPLILNHIINLKGKKVVT